MTLSRIVSHAAWGLPFLGIVLALANWTARPDRAWAWSAAIVVCVVMVVVRQLSQRTLARPSGDPAAAKSTASVNASVIWGSLIVVVALALTLAQVSGVVSDPDLRERLTMAIIGAAMAASGNALPRMLPPASSLHGDAARVQAFQRRAGWAFVLGGLGFAAAWLVLPIDAALPVSVAVVVAALAFTVVQLLRLRSRGREIAI
jgi:cobalamin synthase